MAAVDFSATIADDLDFGDVSESGSFTATVFDEADFGTLLEAAAPSGVQLAGTIAAQSGLSMALTVLSGEHLAGTIAAQSSLSMALTVRKRLAGVVAAQSGLSMALTAAAVPGAVTDPFLVLAPLVWNTASGTYAETVTGSAYVNVAFTSTSIRARFDVSHVLPTTGYRGQVKWSVNYGTTQTQLLSGLTASGGVVTLTLGTALGAGTHVVRLWVHEIVSGAGEAWAGTSSIRLLGFQQNDGSQLVTVNYPYRRARKAFWAGDSITATDADSDPFLHHPHMVGEALGWEIGLFAWGGWGWPGGVPSSGVPAFHNPADETAQAWRWHRSGVSRLTAGGQFVEQPHEIVVNLGTNSGAVQATVEDWIADVRFAAPSARIWVMIPFGGFGRAGLTAAVAAKRAAGDTSVYLLDLAPTVASDGVREPERGLNGFTGASFRASDGVHLLVKQQGFRAAMLVARIKELTATAGAGGSRRRPQ